MQRWSCAGLFNELRQCSMPEDFVVLTVRNPVVRQGNIRLESSQIHPDNVAFSRRRNTIWFLVKVLGA